MRWTRKVLLVPTEIFEDMLAECDFKIGAKLVLLLYLVSI